MSQLDADEVKELREILAKGREESNPELSILTRLKFLESEVARLREIIELHNLDAPFRLAAVRARMGF